MSKLGVIPRLREQSPALALIGRFSGRPEALASNNPCTQTKTIRSSPRKIQHTVLTHPQTFSQHEKGIYNFKHRASPVLSSSPPHEPLRRHQHPDQRPSNITPVIENILGRDTYTLDFARSLPIPQSHTRENATRKQETK